MSLRRAGGAALAAVALFSSVVAIADGLLKRKLSNSDPIRASVERVATRWGEDNIMNDNGVLVSAYQLVGQLERNALNYLGAMTLKRRLEGIDDKLRFPPNAKVLHEHAVFSEALVESAVQRIASEGFGYDTSNKETMSSLRRTLWYLVRQLGLGQSNGLVLTSRVRVPVGERQSKYLTAYFFINLETEKTIQIVLKEGNL